MSEKYLTEAERYSFVKVESKRKKPTKSVPQTERKN